jgi:4-hydroxybenzoate polyprenyltransferase
MSKMSERHSQSNHSTVIMHAKRIHRTSFNIARIYGPLSGLELLYDRFQTLVLLAVQFFTASTSIVMLVDMNRISETCQH